jgi:hypothetical protein
VGLALRFQYFRENLFCLAGFRYGLIYPEVRQSECL